MIRPARKADRKPIFDLQAEKLSLSREDGMEFYFAQLFNDENILINEVDGRVAGSLQVNHHALLLNGQKIMVTTLLGFIGRVSEEMMEDVLDECEHKSLVSLIMTDKPDRFYQYGFKPLYGRKKYHLNRKDLPDAAYGGVDRYVNVRELMEVYRHFTGFFDGCYERNAEYWIRYNERLKFRRSSFAVYRDGNDRPRGYMAFRTAGERVEIDEIAYLNGEALVKLLGYALHLKDDVEVTVSVNEDFSAIIPQAREEEKETVLARINDFELFSRLYYSDVKTTAEGFQLSGRPLWLNEMD